MIEKIIGDKKYILSNITYHYEAGMESLYMEVTVMKDVGFGTFDYKYGIGFNQDEIDFFIGEVSSMTDYVVQKLLDEHA